MKRLVLPQRLPLFEQQIREAGQIQHLQIRILLSKLPRDFGAVHLRNVQIREQQIESIAVGGREECFGTAKGQRRFVPGPMEHAIDKSQNRHLVVDHENASRPIVMPELAGFEGTGSEHCDVSGHGGSVRCIRSNNEDYYLLAPALGLYLVADGMGGAQAGEHASKLAAETVGEFVYKAGAHEPGLLIRAFEEANRRVLEAANLDPTLEGMGTTLVAVIQSNGEAFVTSVGDSRAYIFKDGLLAVVTEDQTWVNEVGRRLGIEEAQLKSHPMRHVLTMEIGVSESLRTHSYVFPLEPGVQVLLCSDGLHGVIGDQVISGALAAEGTLEEKAHNLIQLARAAGGPDNITTVLLRVTDKTE